MQNWAKKIDDQIRTAVFEWRISDSFKEAKVLYDFRFLLLPSDTVIRGLGDLIEPIFRGRNLLFAFEL